VRLLPAFHLLAPLSTADLSVRAGTSISLPAHTTVLVTGFGDERDCLSSVSVGASYYFFVQPTRLALLAPARHKSARLATLCDGSDCSRVFPGASAAPVAASASAVDTPR